MISLTNISNTAILAHIKEEMLLLHISSKVDLFCELWESEWQRRWAVLILQNISALY